MLRRMRVTEAHGRFIQLPGSSTLTNAREARVAEIRPLRVLLADGHPVFRAGLRTALARSDDLQPAGEAHDAAEAARRVVELRPDVVVLDPPAAIADAVRATGLVVSATAEKTRVVILTSREDLPSVLAAVRAGARGYVLKGTAESDILQAIRAVGRGHATFCDEVADRLLEHLAATDPPIAAGFRELSERERGVLELLAQGASPGQIAQRLHVAPKTVRNHVSSICFKLDALDRTQAALLAREAGYGAMTGGHP